ncbi:MAG TPA: PRC-barrel domain-containing protein [Burkholderiales bacterium]
MNNFLFASFRAGALIGTLLLACGAQAAPVSAGALLGARVADAEGAQLGTIHDLAVDVAAGYVRYAIVEKAETSRNQREVRAAPITALRPGLARGQLVLESRTQVPPGNAGGYLMRAKAILGRPIDHPTGADYGTIRDVFFELESGRVLHAEVSLEAAANGVKRKVPFDALRFPPAQPNAILTLGSATLPASQLIGMEVRNRDAGTKGRIDELVVDLHNSRVHYVVLDMEHRLITEPLERLSFTPGRQYAVLPNATRGIAEPRAGMTLARASELIGWEFENEPGVDLGVISDLSIDPQTGRVSHALVRLHEAPGRMQRLELSRFSMSPWRENLVLAEPSAAAGATTPAGGVNLFERLDRDGNGFIEDSELDSGIVGRRNWIAVDLDRDDRISRDEFTAMRTQ